MKSQLMKMLTGEPKAQTRPCGLWRAGLSAAVWPVKKENDKQKYEGVSCMNFSLIDEYVYLVLTDNGWTEKRDFLIADSWIEKIKQKCGIHCFEYARGILHLFGGM